MAGFYTLFSNERAAFKRKMGFYTLMGIKRKNGVSYRDN